MNNETRSGVTIDIDLDPAHMPKPGEQDFDPNKVADIPNSLALWEMLQKLASDYEYDGYLEAFDEEYLSEAITRWDLYEFCRRYKAYEAIRAMVRPGDEIRYVPPCYPHPSEGGYTFWRTGVVVEKTDKNYIVLTNTHDHFSIEYVSINNDTIQKTGNVIYKFRKEDNNGAKNS